jgi:hypothetical protein
MLFFLKFKSLGGGVYHSRSKSIGAWGRLELVLAGVVVLLEILVVVDGRWMDVVELEGQALSAGGSEKRHGPVIDNGGSET